MYLEGMEAGFRHVEGKEYPTRLLHLKGRRNVRVKEVECKRESLNEGDVFVLDLGLMMYQWNGADANRMEKTKGLEVCTRLRNDRGGKPKMKILDSGTQDDSEAFWEALGGKGPIASAEEGGSDAAEEKKPSRVATVQFADFAKIEEERTLKKAYVQTDSISSNGCYIYRLVPKKAKRDDLKLAQDCISKNNRPLDTGN